VLELHPMAHRAEPLMKNGGTLFTMTYYGSQMAVKNLQHHGSCEGGPGGRRALHGGGAWAAGHPRDFN
jgi:hypothetical protein